MASDDERQKEIKDYALTFAKQAIDALVDVFTDDEQKGAARAVASKTLLDRALGAPERKTETKVDVSIVDQRQAHLKALQTLASRNQPAIPLIEDAEYEEVQKK